MPNKESQLESDCLLYVRQKLGRMPKWTSPGNIGVPDRILFLPNKPPVFIEFKTPSGTTFVERVERWLNGAQS